MHQQPSSTNHHGRVRHGRGERPTPWQLILVAALIAAGLPEGRGAERPNLIVIMADDLGYGDLSSYGGWIETPHLDRLAAGGLRWTDFHSSGNVCSPTRAGLLTGRYQQRAGIPGVIAADPTRAVHYHGLQLDEVTFAEVLRSAGYATALFGKWHLGYDPAYNPIHQGFDEFRGYVSGNIDFFSHVDQAGAYDWWHQDQLAAEEGYTTHLLTRHAVRFIESHRDQPFCLYLPHETPHYPYQGPRDSAEREVGKVEATQGARRDIRAAYREMVQELDRGIGEVLATVQRLGLAERTLVMFFSDNGANRNGSNGPLRGFKGSDWEGGHRVPCIMSWPGRIPAGAVCDELAITLDVMPTLLASAGAPLPDSHALDGVSLVPCFSGEPLPQRTLFWNGRAMRDGGWKLIQADNAGERAALYDLTMDLGETTDRASAEPDRVQAMLASLARWKQDVASGDQRQPHARAAELARQARGD